MDQALIRKTAEELEVVLNKYCDVNEYVGYLKSIMTPLIRDAKNEKRTDPIECNTSTYRILFEEHGLRGFRDLERAYAHFRLQITGGMTDQRRRLLEIFEKNKKEIEEEKRKKALEERNKPD